MSAASQTSRCRDVSKATDLDKVLFKTAMCKRYADTGYCSYGDQCGFAHGESDLRKLSATERANLALITKRETVSPSIDSKTKGRAGSARSSSVSSLASTAADINMHTISPADKKKAPLTVVASKRPSLK